MTRLAPLLLTLTLAGCSSDDDAPAFAALGIEVENEIGGRSQVSCEALPFLPGSRRLTEHVIDGVFSITVWSSASEARLTFEEGARELNPELVIPRATLEGEYAEELTLRVVSGQRYFVSIGSGCTP